MFDLCTLRYLQEVGYTGTILDVKSRARALLGLTVVNPSESRPEPMINGTKASSPKDGGVLRYDTTGQSGFSNHVIFLLLAVNLTLWVFFSSKPDPLDRAVAFRAFKFIERTAAEFSIEHGENGDKSIHEPAEVRWGLLWFLWVSSIKCERSEFVRKLFVDINVRESRIHLNFSCSDLFAATNKIY